jgi:hypothetical protein
MARRIIAVAALLGACLYGAASPRARTDTVFNQIDSIVRTLSSITGLEEKHPVPYGRMSKRQLRHFLNKRIKKTLKPEEIEADELALKMFGFVPQDFDLRKTTMDLLTEQAAAFYDYDEKKLFLMEGSSPASEATTLAHELSHALADQHFNLSDFMDEKPASDDEDLAHSAVVEGEACWLMLAYNLKEAGQPPEPTPEMLRTIIDSSSAPTTDYPVLSDAPLYIQQSLLFPYAEGTAFFDAVYHKFGKRAFALVFTDPPVASSQILHPDRYFAHERPSHPPLPEVRGVHPDREITEGTLGEFDHKMLIRQYAGATLAAQLSPHLRGGQFQIVGYGKDRKPLLRYVSEWDSPEQAARFFSSFGKILSGKWEHLDLSLRSAAVLAGTGDSGLFVASLQGRFVTSVEGLSDAAEWERLKSAAQVPRAVAVLRYKLH